MPTAYLNRRWISNFFEKNSFRKNRRCFIQYCIKPELLLPKNLNVIMVCSIQSIFQEAEAFLPVSPWEPPEIHWKPEGMLPKKFFLVMVCFLQAFIEPWEPNDRLHGIPGDNLARASRKGVENPCRENAIHRIPLMPASMTACWKCAFRFPALGSVSGKKQRRKKWNA